MDTYGTAARAFLAEALKKTGLKPNALAKKAGVSSTTISRPMNDPDFPFSPKLPTLAKISAASGVPLPPELSRAPATTSLGSIALPVRYEVAAGAWKAFDEVRQDPAEPEMHPAVDDPRYRGAAQWLERVVGDSYNRRVPEGALVHVVDIVAIDYEPKHGDTVVVVRSRAEGAFFERTLKQVELVPGGGRRLWPRSFNPLWAEPIDFAAGMGDPAYDEVKIVGLVIQAYIGFEEG